MGVPGDFTEPTVETTTDKVTTTEVTTLPDADETTALNNGNGQIANPETTASENKRNGCGSLISGGLTSVTAALAGIFAIKKKKKESKK